MHNNLQHDEDIRHIAEVHWYIFVGPAMLILLGASLSTTRYQILNFLSLALLMLGFVQLVWRIIVRLGSEYVVTNKKVILKSGILNRDALELTLDKCDGLQISQSLIGRLLGFGTVTVSAGSTTSTFKYIANPMKFKDEINVRL